MTVRLRMRHAFAVALLGILACQGPRTLSHRSGLMEYLYPARATAPAPNPAGAQLKLPLRLGIAFVPSAAAAWRVGNAVPAASEKPLLDIVRDAFKDRPWVQDIKVIPSNYLTPAGGFDNLAQIRAMYGVDVMALISVDQIQYTDPKWYTFAYISLVGAYVLPGERNDTRTLIDAAVFDIPSRTFLLRAPGQSVVKGSATPIQLQAQLRADSMQGLALAMKDLTGNLDRSVAEFKTDVAAGARPSMDVVDQAGQSLQKTGGQDVGGRRYGGAFGGLEVLAGLGLLAAAARRRS